MGFSLGVFAKAYRMTTGSRSSWGTADSNGFYVGAAPGNLAVMPNIKGDLTFNFPDNAVDITVRGGGGWKAYDYGLKDVSVDITMLYDNTDGDVIALTAANIARRVAGASTGTG